MSVRNRLEVMLDSIATLTPIENPRNRLEILVSAIAQAIGGAGGGGGGEVIYSNPENTTIINNSYSLTIEGVTFSDYKDLIVYTTDQAGANAASNVMTLVDSSAGQRFMGTSGGYYELYYDATNNAIKGTSKYNGQNCIRQIIGVK